MFEPFRCEECIYGEYLPQDDCWDSGCNAGDEQECEKLFEEDERTQLNRNLIKKERNDYG